MSKRINLSRAAKRQRPTELDRWFDDVLREKAEESPPRCRCEARGVEKYGIHARTCPYWENPDA